MFTLPDSILDQLSTGLHNLYGKNVKLANVKALTGGSIHTTCLVTLDNDQTLFLKYSLKPELQEAFRAEFDGLKLFRNAALVRVPEPLFCTGNLLLCEAIRFGTRNEHWQESLGRQLATLHLATRQNRFGLDESNFIGATPQPNGWYDSWLAFWREQRLAFQLELFGTSTHREDLLLSLGNRLLDKLDQILTVNEPAVLLHGDLWSGNAAADEHGDPILFDPAVYYGQREAEFGMMRLFGGFGQRAEAAYQEIWPFDPGYDERIAVFRLYHELNHLNIFGRSYYSQCMETLRSLC